MTGFEEGATAQNAEQNAKFAEQVTQIPAHLATDAQFSLVLDAWPTLPDAVKAGIVAMMRVLKKPDA